MRRRCPSLLTVLAVLAFVGALAVPANAAAPAWTTYRHDAARSGSDPGGTPAVTPSQAWQTPELDGQVYAQPLLYGSYVYVATENDTIYKLDAASGAVAWSAHLATPEPASVAPCGDVTPSIGITSTPVIDLAADRIYAVGAVSTQGTIAHKLFALDLSTGQPIAGFPIAVDPPFPAGGDPVNQLQRAGLALVSGRILIGYGGNDGDCNTYWGWLVSAPTDGTTALSSFQVDPGYTDGAIWGAGNAPPVDGAGNVFVATGNGTSSSASDPAYGDSIVKLNASAAPLDWWAPTNWQSLDSGDADLGSSMPTLLPGGFLFQAGKDGNGYVVNGAGLGHVRPPVAEASGFCSGGSFGGAVYDPTNATIYAACSGGLRALSLGAGSPPSIASNAGFSAPSGATGPPTIAGGLVWVTNHSSGTLYGLDPASGATRSHFAIPETGTDVNHFATASAGGGRLFVGSGDQVTAFTIAQAPPADPTNTTLASSLNPAAAGTAVVLRAAVSPAPDAGTVTFTDGGVPIAGCAIALSAAKAGNVSCQTTFTRARTHTLAAAYSGDPFYARSTSTGIAESIRAAALRPRGPVISHASLSPRRFRSIHPATLRLTLSEAATLTVTITAPRRGHLVGRRCATTKSRRGKSCVVHVRRGGFHFHARARRRSFTLRLRRLAPGRYTAAIFATDRARLRSRTIRITFTIIRPKR